MSASMVANAGDARVYQLRNRLFYKHGILVMCNKAYEGMTTRIVKREGLMCKCVHSSAKSQAIINLLSEHHRPSSSNIKYDTLFMTKRRSHRIVSLQIMKSDNVISLFFISVIDRDGSRMEGFHVLISRTFEVTLAPKVFTSGFMIASVGAKYCERKPIER